MTLKTPLRSIVIGLGVQGRKRLAIAGKDVIATVDPLSSDADHRALTDVPLDAYDAAFVCTPDDVKIPLLDTLLRTGKHVLVEKPLLADDATLVELEALADATGSVCYTAYNHRFEPHLVELSSQLTAGEVGDLYRLRLFYGNGTAADVRASPWRDQGAGVLPDLGSHLLDLLLFLLGSLPDGLEVWSAQRFENRAFDHIVCGTRGRPLIELEMSLLSWRNHFVAEAVGSNGSLLVESLCKWGPSIFTHRRRVLPSGRPTESLTVLEQADPTWQAEHDHFVAMCTGERPRPRRDADRAISLELARLAEAAAS